MTQYRFLNVGEVVEKSDQFSYEYHAPTDDNGWGPASFTGVLPSGSVGHYRRRIHKAAKASTAKEVKQKPTYRFLNYGETVLATDEWAEVDKNFEDWEPVSFTQVGTTINTNPSLKYRREVKVEVVSVQPLSFIEELRNTINRHSKENGSNTPDFILAEFLNDALNSYDKSVKARDKWYGKELSPGGDYNVKAQ